MALADDEDETKARAGNGGTWAGFLAAMFCIVGMMGLFATYAAPLPYQREMFREAALDRVLTVPAGQRDALRATLGDSADAVLTGDTDVAGRVARERASIRTRFTAEADETAQRLRLLIVVITIMGALLGAVMLGLQRRG